MLLYFFTGGGMKLGNFLIYAGVLLVAFVAIKFWNKGAGAAGTAGGDPWSDVDTFYAAVKSSPQSHPELVVKWVNYIEDHRDDLEKWRKPINPKVNSSVAIYEYLRKNGTDEAVIRKLLALDNAEREVNSALKDAGLPENDRNAIRKKYRKHYMEYTGAPLIGKEGSHYFIRTAPPR